MYVNEYGEPLTSPGLEFKAFIKYLEWTFPTHKMTQPYIHMRSQWPAIKDTITTSGPMQTNLQRRSHCHSALGTDDPAEEH